MEQSSKLWASQKAKSQSHLSLVELDDAEVGGRGRRDERGGFPSLGPETEWVAGH